MSRPTLAHQPGGSNISICKATAIDGGASCLLLPFGQIELQGNARTWYFTREAAVGLVSAFKSLGRPLVIDYDHQTLATLLPAFSSEDGLAPAAGWIGDLEVRANGLWASPVQWTSKAIAAMSTSRSSSLEPVVFWRDQPGGAARALGPVGLKVGFQAVPTTVSASRGFSVALTPHVAAGVRSKHDHLTMSKAWPLFREEDKQLHLEAVAMADAGGISYAAAVSAIVAGRIEAQSQGGNAARSNGLR